MSFHENQLVLRGGLDARDAQAALILIHGRGASAADIMSLAGSLDVSGLRLVAPQAEGRVWYPQSFLAPREHNEEGIQGAFRLIGELIDELETEGITRNRIMLLGFSQGACLSLDYVYHHPARYGAVFALSGGLIGPPDTEFPPRSELAGTPVFIGCSDVDPFIPADRVRESHAALEASGAEIETKIYPGMGHTVNSDEISRVNRIITRLTNV
jgi:predicted esterase